MILENNNINNLIEGNNNEKNETINKKDNSENEYNKKI